MMDLDKETPFSINHFEETLLSTPKPQACSTVDKKTMENFIYKDSGETHGSNEQEIGGGDATKLTYLDANLRNLAEMKARLAMGGFSLEANIPTEIQSSLTTSSSLGILSVKDVAVDLDSSDLLIHSLNLGNEDVRETKWRKTREEAQKLLERTDTVRQSDISVHSSNEISSRKTRKESVKELETINSLPNERSSQLVEFRSPSEQISGFTELFNASQISRDEKFCIEQWGEPLVPTDLSLTGRFTSQPSINFMPNDDSFLQSLGPTDPPRKDVKTEYDNKKSSALVDSSYDEVMKAYLGETRLGRMDSDVSIPSLEEISKALRKMPPNENPRLLMDSLLGNSSETLNLGESFLRSCEDNSIKLNERGSSMSSLVMKGQLTSTGQPIENKTPSKDEETKVYTRWGIIGCVLEVFLETDNAVISSVDKSNVLVEVTRSSDNLLRAILTPLVIGEVTIILREPKGRLHVIVVFVEEPKLDLSCIESLDFGSIPDCSSKSLKIKLKSQNKGLLALCSIITQDLDGVFKFSDEDRNIFLFPGEELVKTVTATAPLLSSDAKASIRGKLEFCINISEKFMPRKIVSQLTLTVESVKTQLSIDMLHDRNEGVIYPGKPHLMKLFNGGLCTLDLQFKVEGSGFYVQPTKETIAPTENASITISYLPYEASAKSKGFLLVNVVPTGRKFRIAIEGFSGTSVASPTSSSVSSLTRSGTPNSLNSTLGPGQIRGPLELDCTTGYFVWGSLPLNSKQEKSCTLRSRANFREKLCFSLQDPTWSFHFVKDGKMQREMKLSLETLHKKELKICFSPKVKGPLRALVEITRVEEDMEKKSIQLLGYGGRCRLQAVGIAFDMDSSSQVITLCIDSGKTSLYFRNTGDGPAYFYISQPCLEETLLEVDPKYGVVLEGETKEVQIGFTLSSPQVAKIEEVLKNPSPILKLSTLTIYQGDHSTILRLLRLYRKYGKSCKDSTMKPIMKNLGETFLLLSSEARKSSNVEILKDPLSSLNLLYQDGVREWKIEVFMNKKTLEQAALDMTQQYLSLDNSITEDATVNESQFSFF